MNQKTNTALLSKLLDAIKIPHVAMMVGMLGTTALFAWMFISFIQAAR